jgi:hypothetical protein
MSKLRDRAIVADIISSPTRLVIAHKKGINVLYANGGAKWVQKDHIQYDDDGRTPLLDGMSGFVAANNPKVDKLWAKLDKAP